MTLNLIDRPSVLQPILDLFPGARYLEIGVSEGATFHAVTASVKVAVDPNFRFPFENHISEDSEVIYHQSTSDSFFEQYRSGVPFDVVYLDGLHTYDQTLRDLLNAAILLQPKGVIVIDDVLPDTYSASLSQTDCSEFRARTGELFNSWMGDVFKVVYFVSSFMQQFDYRTIANNHGQLVMWRGVRPEFDLSGLSLSEISGASYLDTILRREYFKLAQYHDIFDLIYAASDRAQVLEYS